MTYRFKEGEPLPQMENKFSYEEDDVEVTDDIVKKYLKDNDCFSYDNIPINRDALGIISKAKAKNYYANSVWRNGKYRRFIVLTHCGIRVEGEEILWYVPFQEVAIEHYLQQLRFYVAYAKPGKVLWTWFPRLETIERNGKKFYGVISRLRLE